MDEGMTNFHRGKKSAHSITIRESETKIGGAQKMKSKTGGKVI